MKIFVFQYFVVEYFGIFCDFWVEDGYSVYIVVLDEGVVIFDLDGFDLLVVMGGLMDVWDIDVYLWLVLEMVVIWYWVCDLVWFYLGICLGYQFLVQVLGGIVGLMVVFEVGIIMMQLLDVGCDDLLFCGLLLDLQVF